MRMRKCPTCKYADQDRDDPIKFWCRVLPPRPIVLPDPDRIEFMVPPMLRNGWCGLHKFSLFKVLMKLFKGDGA